MFFFLQDLKQLLNTTLGIGSHRIEPRHKGDSVLRVSFRSKDEMDVARDILHKQIYMGCKLTAVVSGKFIVVAIVVLFTMRTCMHCHLLQLYAVGDEWGSMGHWEYDSDR